MEKYIRVECLEVATMEVLGGYMCALMSILRRIYKVPPTIPDEELAKLVSTTDSPAGKAVMSLLAELGDIPHPDIYIQDKANHICLYRFNEFEEAVCALEELSDLVYTVTKEQLGIYFKVFELEDDELLYSDPYQVVISKETYNKKKYEHSHMPIELGEVFIEEFYDEMFGDSDDDWDDEI